MKKGFKITLGIFLSVLVVILCLFTYFLIATKDVKLDSNKLISINQTIVLVDNQGVEYEKIDKNQSICDIKDIPSCVQKAFISIEDKRFYTHKGVDFKALIRASLKNIKSLSFKEGASTISQQLIKNTHLTNEKTLKRKLNEIKLAFQLEKKFNKNEILQIYLNTIYFGNNCYGIKSASNFYFNKEPSELSLNEGAVLASIIKAPSIYSPVNNVEKCIQRRNTVLLEMKKNKYITDNEYLTAKNSDIILSLQRQSKSYSYNYLVKNEINSFLDNNAYFNGEIRVYTNVNHNLQQILMQNNSNINTDKTSIIISKEGKILAYNSTCGEIYRQMGSVAKPLFVYAPAIEENIYDSCSLILDEETDFNGYKPKNYNDKYYGYVSLKNSLAKSLNVCSVKVMQSLGVDKALNYAKKLNFNINEGDKNLALALGATSNGATLKQITSAYTTFINKGNYVLPHSIEKICDANDRILFKNKSKQTKVFGEDTSFIINDMLKHAVNEGTAKKLSFLDYQVCAKTGTVGNANGNYDAYCISYTQDYVLGTWFGNKDNSLIDNSITGGTIPTQFSQNIWSNIFENEKPNEFYDCKFVEYKNIDKISYENDHIVEFADDNAPKRYVINEIFKKSNNTINKSTRFSSPKVENINLSVNNNDILMCLCLTQYTEALIYREYNGVREKIIDTINLTNKEKILDDKVMPNKNYSYYVIPYFSFDGRIVYGKEEYVGTIKTPPLNYDGEWWLEN